MKGTAVTLEDALDQHLNAVLEGREESDQAAASAALDEADRTFGEDAVCALIEGGHVAGLVLQGLSEGYSREHIGKVFDRELRRNGGTA